MPDKSSTERVRGQPEDNGAEPETTDATIPPDQPNPADTKRVASQQLETDVQALTDRIKRAEKWMIGLTGAIAFFALCSVIVAVLQWISSNNQGIDAHNLAVAAGHQADAATDMATAAGDQVDAGNNFADSAEEINRGVSGAVNQLQAAAKNTRTAVENAQTSFRDEQRAWVGVSALGTMDFSETKPWNVAIQFFNSGRTPARNVQSSVRYTLSATPLSEPPPEAIKALTFRPAQSIAPQGKYTLVIGYSAAGEPSAPFEVTGLQELVPKFQDIKTGKITLYYFGILKYDDVFGNHRETQYCIFLANPETKQAAFCDGFNDLN